MSEDASTKAREWFESGAWRNGLQLNADASTNVEEFYRQYNANTAAWDKALLFLKEQDLQHLPPGKHEIDGENVYASVSEGPNMEFDDTSWESHKKYNDIQYVISGKEKVGLTTAANAIVTKEYDPAQDIMFYTADGPTHSFEPGKFFIFFPTDLHRPGIKENTDLVKKVVLKIKTLGG